MKLLKKSVSVLLSIVIVFSLFAIVEFEAGAESGYDAPHAAGMKKLLTRPLQNH